MSDGSALSLALLRRVAEFLDSLAEHHIADLAAGRARLTHIPWGANEPVPPAAPRNTRRRSTPVDATAILAELKVASSRDEGLHLLGPLNVTNLRTVAKAAGMTGTSKTPKDDLVDQIVSLTIGGRASYAAIREL